MPVSYSKLKSETVALDIPVGEDVLRVEYRPGAYTPEFLDKLQDARETGSVSKALVASTQEVLVSWDLLDDEQKPMPITAEVIAGLPVAFIRAIAEGIAGDLVVPKGTSAPSGSFS